MVLGRASAVVRTLGLAALAALAVAAPANAVTITEFDTNPGKVSVPLNIVGGADGNLWWTEIGSEPGIGRMSPSGERFPVIPDGSNPIDLAAAPSGWVSWVSQEGFGSRSPSGLVTRTANSFSAGAITLTPSGQIRFGGREGVSVICSPQVPTSDHLETEFACAGEKFADSVEGIAAAPDGTLWASASKSNAVFISSTAHFGFTTRVDLPAGSDPVGIAIGPEGNAWVAMWEAGAIDRITPAGARTRFLLPVGSRPNDLVLGPDGAFWILESGTGRIARMTTTGTVTGEYPVPSGETGQLGITVGPDRNIWFTDPEAAMIGRLVPDPPIIAGGGSSGGSTTTAPAVAPALDAIAPRFTAAPTLRPARFRVAAGKAHGSSRGGAPSGSTLRFSLSEAASVTVTLARGVPGRRLGSRCVAPGKAKPSAGRCARFVGSGGLKIDGAAGPNKLAFSGRPAGRALRPGRYRATFIAADPAGNASGPSLAGFVIVGAP
jgi:streptogramin lyase